MSKLSLSVFRAVLFFALLTGGPLRAEGFAIVAHPSLTSELTLDQLGHLFLGRKIDTGNDLRLLPLLITREKELHRSFAKKVLKRSPAQLKSYIAKQVFTGKGKPPAEASNIEKLRSMVAENSRFITYLPLSEDMEGLQILFIFDE